MKRILSMLSVLAMALVLAACAAGLQTQFSAQLTPEAEVPAPTLNGATPEGSATATLDADGTTLVVQGTFTGLTGAATGAHIHGPAAEGESAGVVFPLTVDDATSGSFSGTWTGMTEAQVQALRDGLYYINVHTALNAPGEIRGQLE